LAGSPWLPLFPREKAFEVQLKEFPGHPLGQVFDIAPLVYIQKRAERKPDQQNVENLGVSQFPGDVRRGT
jgi:hypothetical protein